VRGQEAEQREAEGAGARHCCGVAVCAAVSAVRLLLLLPALGGRGGGGTVGVAGGGRREG
jgi:hypothetical protein